MSQPAWTRKPNAVEVFSRFCAPTALAALMECEVAEAAELLLSIPGMPCPSPGGVMTWEWEKFLVNDLGLVSTPTERDKDEARRLAMEARERNGWAPGEFERVEYREDRYGWNRDRIISAPHAGQRIYRYPTLAQWLKANPTATGIVNVQGHTLFVKDGQVAADTKTTKSMRARIEGAFLVKQETN
jgi:hypothetical protein